jgi:hypothetical protein
LEKMAAGNTGGHVTAPAPFDPNGDPSAVSVHVMAAMEEGV